MEDMFIVCRFRDLTLNNLVKAAPVQLICFPFGEHFLPRSHHESHQPLGDKWFKSSVNQITLLHTLFLSLRSGGPGSLARVYHFLQNMQNAKRELQNSNAVDADPLANDNFP